jgi:hypothetical protein
MGQGNLNGVSAELPPLWHISLILEALRHSHIARRYVTYAVDRVSLNKLGDNRVQMRSGLCRKGRVLMSQNWWDAVGGNKQVQSRASEARTWVLDTCRLYAEPVRACSFTSTSASLSSASVTHQAYCSLIYSSLFASSPVRHFVGRLLGRGIRPS